MVDIKIRIMLDLSLGVVPTYTRYGLPNEEFLRVLAELKREGYINYTLIDGKLPNGTPVPHYGDLKHAWLTDKGKEFMKNWKPDK